MIFTLGNVLSVVLCLAVGVMVTWHLLSIARGETTVESHDHDLYRKAARSRGEVRTFDVHSEQTNLLLCYSRSLSIHMMSGWCALHRCLSKLMRIRFRRNLELFFNVGPSG